MKRSLLLLFTLCLFQPSCTFGSKKLEPDTKPISVQPKLLAPSVHKIWVAPVFKDNGQEWEEGHYVYRIERGVSWSR